MTEKDIMHENGIFWVLRTNSAYVVMKTVVTCSESVQAFAPDADGLSLAKAYCDYKAKHAK